MTGDHHFIWGRHDLGDKINGIPRPEYHVLIGLCNLYSAEETAVKMQVSVNTVRSHRLHLFARLGVNAGAAAVQEAWRRKILNTCPTCRRVRNEEASQVDLDEIIVPEKSHGVEGVKLTKRMNQVLRLIAQGLSNPEIGKALGVSELTAKTHVRLLFAGLNVHDRAHAVAVGYELGLLKIGDTPR